MCKEYHVLRDELRYRLEPYNRIVVFFSGGLDSSLLLKEVNSLFVHKVLAITFTSPFHTFRSLQYARIFAKDCRVKHILIDYRPLKEEGIVLNSSLRCYLCKRKMFYIARQCVGSQDTRTAFIDGSHIGDDPAQRPGMKANKEFNIMSPWREIGFGKGQIRSLAKYSGLSIWNSPPDSCLATRFPPGYRLKVKELRRLEDAEESLRALGFIDFRIRPADSPPKILFSEADYKRAVLLGSDYLWGIIKRKTGWDIVDGGLCLLTRDKIFLA